MSVRKSFLAVAAMLAATIWFAPVAFAANANQNVIATVNGAPNVTIGTIAESISVNGTQGQEQSIFTFAPGSGALDTWYDFHFFQMITADPIPPKNFAGNAVTVPYVDTPLDGYDYQKDVNGKPGDDRAPFYEHEDTAQTPGGGTFKFPTFAFAKTHVEGVSSSISDFPGLTGLNGMALTFQTFLVATPNENADGTFPVAPFQVLAGYQWSFQGMANDTNFVATGPTAVAVNAALIATMQTAVTNGGFDNTKWVPQIAGNLSCPVPEASTLGEFSIGFVGILVLLVRKRTRTTAV